jgi:hypothetical protein
MKNKIYVSKKRKTKEFPKSRKQKYSSTPDYLNPQKRNTGFVGSPLVGVEGGRFPYRP